MIRIICLFLLLAVQATAQPFTSRTIHLVVPFAAGGTTDVTARILARELNKNEGLTVVVENRPGALGSIGANHVISQQPDGHTLLFTSNGILANRFFSNNPDVDVISRLTPVANVIESAMVMMVANNVPASDARSLVTLIKQKPNFYHYGTSSGGGTLQIAASLFLRAANIEMIAVPYSGGSSAATDLLGGRITLMFDSNIVGMQHHRAGTARAMAVTSPIRSRNAPDVPTLREIGLNTEFVAWQGVYVSKNTPTEILQILNSTINRTLQTSSDRFLESGADRVMNENLSELSARVNIEIDRLNTALNKN